LFILKILIQAANMAKKKKVVKFTYTTALRRLAF